MQSNHKNDALSAFEALKLSVRAGRRVCAHSGEVQAGDVFVAVHGPRLDGAAFIADAAARGASTIVTDEQSETPAELPATVEVLRCADPRQALGELASAYYKTEALSFPVIGVTGTNGKTTVSFLIEQLFAANAHKVGVLGTVTYRWPGFAMDAPLTTPGCLLLHEHLRKMRKAGVNVAIMEVSSHALDQQRIAGLTFAAGVWTNLTQDHLDYHKDMEAYFLAKARLFNEAPALDKPAVLNWDDEYCRRLLGTPNAIGFGLDPAHRTENGLFGEILEMSIKGLKLRMRFQGRSWELRSPLVGAHNASNLLAAQALGLALGMPVEQFQVLSDFVGVTGRLERIPNRNNLNIFVDYAHTPDALENVLRSLKAMPFGKLITVFGCGGDRDRGKRPLMGAAVCKYSDIAVLTSDNPRHEDPIAIMNDVRPGMRDCIMVMEIPNRRQAISVALDEMRPSDVLLIAGKGHESYQQIGDKKHPFSDQAVVREILG
jgi:UDP-N-acetylmuramoyl-L-alanyl-D-glutamate--2,6-diaminopimelate ligase